MTNPLPLLPGEEKQFLMEDRAAKVPPEVVVTEDALQVFGWRTRGDEDFVGRVDGIEYVVAQVLKSASVEPLPSPAGYHVDRRT